MRGEEPLVPSLPLYSGHLHEQECSTKRGYRDATRRTPRRRFAVGVVGTVTPQIAAPTERVLVPVPSLFLNFRTSSENIELRRVTRYMCTNSRARERHVLSFVARCKCFLSRSPAWEMEEFSHRVSRMR